MLRLKNSMKNKSLYGCWWCPGSLRHQVLSSDGQCRINVFLFSMKIPTTCAISVLQSLLTVKYGFMFPKINSTWLRLDICEIVCTHQFTPAAPQAKTKTNIRANPGPTSVVEITKIHCTLISLYMPLIDENMIGWRSVYPQLYRQTGPRSFFFQFNSVQFNSSRTLLCILRGPTVKEVWISYSSNHHFQKSFSRRAIWQLNLCAALS